MQVIYFYNSTYKNIIMTNKTLAILSYVTLIGWLVSYFSSKEQAPKNPLVSYHLKQGFGLFVVSILFSIALNIIAAVIPALSFLGIISLVFFVFIILGIINANNEQQKPIPVIGKMFENKFSFLN